MNRINFVYHYKSQTRAIDVGSSVQVVRIPTHDVAVEPRTEISNTREIDSQ